MGKLEALREQAAKAVAASRSLDFGKWLSATGIAEPLDRLSAYADWIVASLMVDETAGYTIKGQAQLFKSPVHITLTLTEPQDAPLSFVLNAEPVDPQLSFRMQGIDWLLFRNGRFHLEGIDGDPSSLKGTLSVEVLVGSSWIAVESPIPGETPELARKFRTAAPITDVAIKNVEPLSGSIRIVRHTPFLAGKNGGLTLELDYRESEGQMVNLKASLQFGDWILPGLPTMQSGVLTLEAALADGKTNVKVSIDGTLEAADSVFGFSGTFVKDSNSWSWTIIQDRDKPSPILSFASVWIPSGSHQMLEPINGISVSELKMDVQVVDKATHFSGQAKLISSNEDGTVNFGDGVLRFREAQVSGNQFGIQLAKLLGTVEIGGIQAEVSCAYAAREWTLCGSITSLDGLSGSAGISIDRMTICRDEGNWRISAAVPWTLSEKINVQARLTLDYNSELKKFVGQLCGDADFFGFRIHFCRDMNSGEVTAAWNGFTAVFNPGGNLNEMRFRLTEISLGKLIEEAVTWVKGSDRKFGLTGPWAALNGWSFPELELFFNIDTGITLTSPSLNKSLDFIKLAKIEGFALRYDFNKTLAPAKRLKFELKGSVPGVSSLEWFPADPSTAPTPDLPEGFLDLKLLAMGQRVALGADAGVIDSVDKAISLAHNLQAIRHDPATGWFVAAELLLLKTISLKFVFSDPKLYGLKVVVGGRRGEFFKGLDFEILYQKVSEDIGLYQAEITLPDSLRYLEFGAYSVTLPSFGIGIYTNGDFRIDIGFPRNMDFSRSCTIQTIVPPGIPAIGSAGFYINKLSQYTSNRLPHAHTGHFGTVMEFGFGMRLGIGKEVHKGPLTAGFAVTTIGILEGVLARWQPDGEGKGDYYYRLQGIAGIQGRLFGEVNLSLVKASVDVVVTIATLLDYEAYGDLEISLIADVSIRLKIKIGKGRFKIKISVSYSASIKETFLIKPKHPNPPWRIQTQGDSIALADGESEQDTATLPIPELHWGNLLPPDAGEHPPLTLYLAPVLTAVEKRDGAQTRAEHALVLLFAIGTVGELVNNEEPAALSDFERLCERTWAWLCAAASGQEKPVSIESFTREFVSRDVLNLYKKFLNAGRRVIPPAQLSSFLRNHWTMTVVSDDMQCQPSADGQPPGEVCLETAFFPAPPSLRVKIGRRSGDVIATSVGKDEDYLFAETATATLAYLKKSSERFRWDSASTTVQDAHESSVEAQADELVNAMSVAEYVMYDYFVTIARELVHEALDILDEYVYPLVEHSTLGSAAAAVFDAVNADQDPGSAAPNAEALTPVVRSLLEYNRDVPLRGGTDITLRNVSYLTKESDTWISLKENETFKIEVFDEHMEKESSQWPLKAGEVAGADPAKTIKIEPGDTLRTLADRLALTVTQLLTEFPNVPLLPSSEIKLPPIQYMVRMEQETTLQSVIDQFKLNMNVLASDIIIREQIKFNAASLKTGPLKRLGSSELFSRMRAKGVLRKLSGLISRSFLHGMRLTSDKGLHVQNRLGQAPDYGLFELTGQQIELKELEAIDEWSVSLTSEIEPHIQIIEKDVNFVEPSAH
ncbi:hypothetical protein ACE6ED_20560 [Paenibacillus sp. CN-4]|uniref:hypothetical protein n=1 Tax=Paenibacillus nanchangensis TaxID=3348343 RepID=UPI0039787982